MTALGSRVAMTMRCTTQRRAAGTDSWGQDSGAWADHLTNLSCRGWEVSSQLVIAPGELAPVMQRKLAVPLGTDVLDTDRVSSVTRRGSVVMDGPMTIDDMTIFSDRIEITLRRSA